ncbi:MAG: hypothetical protein QXI58_01470 [Candidatus Micrarchaeia archaeon]
MPKRSLKKEVLINFLGEVKFRSLKQPHSVPFFLLRIEKTSKDIIVVFRKGSKMYGEDYFVSFSDVADIWVNDQGYTLREFLKKYYNFILTNGLDSQK